MLTFQSAKMASANSVPSVESKTAQIDEPLSDQVPPYPQVMRIPFIERFYELFLLNLASKAGRVIFGSCVHLLWAILTGVIERPHVLVKNDDDEYTFRDIDIIVCKNNYNDFLEDLRTQGVNIKVRKNNYAVFHNPRVVEKITVEIFFGEFGYIVDASHAVTSMYTDLITAELKRYGYNNKNPCIKIDVLVVQNLNSLLEDSPNNLVGGMYPESLRRNATLWIKHGSPCIGSISNLTAKPRDLSSTRKALISTVISSLSATIRKNYGSGVTRSGDIVLPDSSDEYRRLQSIDNSYTRYCQLMNSDCDPIMTKLLQMKCLNQDELLSYKGKKILHDEKDDNTCAICSDSLHIPTKPVIVLTCGHIYHCECLAPPLLDLFRTIFHSLQNGCTRLYTLYDAQGQVKKKNLTSCPNCRNDWGVTDLTVLVEKKRPYHHGKDWYFRDAKVLNQFFN